MYYGWDQKILQSKITQEHIDTSLHKCTQRSLKWQNLEFIIVYLKLSSDFDYNNKEVLIASNKIMRDK